MIKNVKFLVGNLNYNLKPFQPFSNKTVNFLNDFSNELNLIKDIKNYPDIKALAFWCRYKNIIKLKKNLNIEKNKIGLGLVFHITPSNIPTNFVYSLIFGLLSGNSNIIKVPSKDFNQIKIICAIISKVLKKNSFIKDKITIVKYKDNDAFTRHISSICNARVIWGGDQTIENIKKFKTNERSRDVTFADRYSFSVISTEKIKKLNNFELNNLVQRFYNDTYLVDQNACSSPHLIIWLGKRDKIAQDKFWNKLFNFIKNKYELNGSASIEKYSDLCKYSLSLNNIKSVHRYDNLIYRIKLNKVEKNNHRNRGKWGLFFEYEINNLNKVKNIINEKYQTLTYFGVEKNLLVNFVMENKLTGIDRIVPVGQSLDIGLLWDGHDILSTLSRGIEIR